MELLPKVPDWKVKKIGITGYGTREPMFLFYRDALDCVEYLLGNPLFSDCIDFCPVRLYQDAEHTIRVYMEWVTGNATWEMQVCKYFIFLQSVVLIMTTVSPPSWRNTSRGHTVVRQNEHLGHDR